MNPEMVLRIEALRRGQVEAAKAVIRAGCFEFFGAAPADFGDMDNVAASYSAPCGIFLVLMDGEQVVGTGAIRRLDEEVCELKRMWFLPVYRGKGYGARMCGELLEFARSAGYRRVRLDTDPRQAAAGRLYRRLGFREIERYNDGPCGVFMERDL
jgi:putative acetyltransferase